MNNDTTAPAPKADSISVTTREGKVTAVTVEAWADNLASDVRVTWSRSFTGTGFVDVEFWHPERGWITCSDATDFQFDCAVEAAWAGADADDWHGDSLAEAFVHTF